MDRNHNNASLVGGFYDSGNNIKFSFSTAYTITVLSWSVIEYRQKYAAMGQLDHIMDIIKWGSDYLLKLFVPADSKSKPDLLYSQVVIELNNKSCCMCLYSQLFSPLTQHKLWY